MQDSPGHGATTLAENAASPPSAERDPEPGWRSVRQWLYSNTFGPNWVPARWSHPLTGYMLAVASEAIAALVTLAMVRIFPTFSFPEALIILVVALASLTWGAGPSLCATFVGTLLLEIVVLPHARHGGVNRAGDVVEIVIFLAVGGIISVTASRTERARRSAVRAHARSHAREEALRATNRRMDDFLSLTSHELRSPLTSIRMALQLAERRLRRLAAHGEEAPAGPVATPESLEAIVSVLALAEHEVERQNRLVGDLLDVGRIQTGKLEFHEGACDLVGIASDAVAAERLAWPGRSIALDVSTDTAPIYADAYRMEQVITNYLTNALKYSDENAPVTAALRVDGSRARLEVRDRGPGLTRDQQERIWERFHRVPGVKQQSGQGAGLGLGLFICRTIVEHHGGTVGVESIRGHGSTFWFILPLAQPAA